MRPGARSSAGGPEPFMCVRLCAGRLCRSEPRPSAHWHVVTPGLPPGRAARAADSDWPARTAPRIARAAARWRTG